MIYIYIHYIHIIFTWKFLRRSLSLFPTWVGLAQRWRHSFLAWLRSPRTVTHQAMLGKIGMVTIFMLKKTPGVPQKSWSWAFSFGRCNISIFLRQRTIYIIIIVIIIIVIVIIIIIYIHDRIWFIKYNNIRSNVLIIMYIYFFHRWNMFRSSSVHRGTGSALAPLAVYPILIAIYLTRTYKR